MCWNMAAPEHQHKSMSKSKQPYSVIERDARIGHIMDRLRALFLGGKMTRTQTDEGR